MLGTFPQPWACSTQSSPVTISGAQSGFPTGPEAPPHPCPVWGPAPAPGRPPCPTLGWHPAGGERLAQREPCFRHPPQGHVKWPSSRFRGRFSE